MVFTVEDTPKHGETWRHYKGGLYIVHCIAIDVDTKEECVIYTDDKKQTTYTRKLSQWFELIDGTTPRFRKEN